MKKRLYAKRGTRQTVFLPEKMPGFNDLIAAAKVRKGKWNDYDRLKHQWTIHIDRQLCRLKPSRKVFINFTWIEPNRRRDPDNIAAGGRKFVLDALVNAGIIPGDGWRHVAGWKDYFSVDKRNPGVVLEIITVK